MKDIVGREGFGFVERRIMLMNLRCGYVCSVKLGGGQIVRKSSVCRVGATREKNVVGTKKLDEKGKGGTDGKDEKKADVDRLRKEKLVRDHLYLVDVIARQSNWLSSPHIEDVLQEGHIGLIYAANKFIPSSGTHFPTYASYWIRQVKKSVHTYELVSYFAHSCSPAL